MNELLADAIMHARSKQVRSIVEWATQEVVIPDGKFRGQKLKLDTQPVSKLLLNEIDSGRWTECVYTGPSQSGKTLIGYVVPLLYHACELAESCVMGVPYGDMAANKWHVDVRPVMVSSPNLRAFIPTSGEGSAGGKVKDMISMSNGGVIKIISAGGDDANKAGFTSRVVVITEAARFSEGSESSEEPDPLRQLRARQRAYPDSERRMYIEGTTTIESELPWRLREQSSRSRIVTPCPHCAAWIAPERSDLMGWEQETEAQARACAKWFCPNCGESISDDDRRTSLCRAVLLHGEQTIEDGNVVGDPPETSRLWFRTSAWHNCFLSAGDLGVDEWKAAQIPEQSPERISADKELCQFVWCSPYTLPKFESDIDLDRQAIGRDRMCSAWPKGLVPDSTTDLSLAIDLGEKEAWFVLLAGLSSGKRHVVDYSAIDVNSHEKPVEYALQEMLDEMLARWETGWVFESAGESSTRSPDEVWIDAGNWGESVKKWVSGRGRKIVAAYGRGETQMDRTRFDLPKRTGNQTIEIDKSGRYYVSFIPASRCYAVFWDSDRGKYEAQQSLSLPVSAPGATTLYAGTRKEHERFARHVCNEKLITEHHPIRGEKQYWKRTGANHLGDCLAMAGVALCRAAARRTKLGSDWE